MGLPSITIITVVLNAKDQIEKTIRSVVSQDYEPLDYIIIDGGSTDGTTDIIRKYEDKIHVSVSEPDRGIAHAFNKGIARAQGSLVGILNAGDSYEPDTLSVVAQTLSSTPDLDVICGAVQFWRADSQEISCQSDPDRLLKETSVYHPTVFITKKTYERYGIFNEEYRYAMDYELLLRYKMSGARFLSIPKILANMEVQGRALHNRRVAMEEVRRARSMYFSPRNVSMMHYRALFKNSVVGALQGLGLKSVHRMYWQLKNTRVERKLLARSD